MRRALLLVTALAACSGEVDTMGVPGESEIRFVSPTADTVTLRDGLDEHGSRVATVEVELEVGGLSRVDFLVAGERIATINAESRSMSLDLEVPMSGSFALTAQGLDGSGEIVARASVSMPVADPDLACIEWLDFFGINHEAGPATQGIAEPVVAAAPIHGIAYIGGGNERDDLLADCSLIHALAESAGVLRARGVVSATDLGVYNYRCIGGGAPPDCPNGVSQHAYAKAIDIAGYTTDDGTYYSVNDDWVIDGDDEDACSAATENDKDSFLHEIICEQKARGIWNIVLTPNYNAAHRDHFHVDLTDGGDFLGRNAPRGH